jgi:uncharacterized C2H2 Zn-finger protein
MVTGDMPADYERVSLESSIADMTASDVTAEQWDEWAEGLRRREAVYREARLRLEALRDGEVLPECEQCGETFVGRSDARYCSTRCRVAAHRGRAKLTEAEKKAKEDERHKDLMLSELERLRQQAKYARHFAEAVKPSGRKKVIGWLQDAIKDIEAL